LIPIEDNSSSYFLGPVGISDPLEFIEANPIEYPSNRLWQDPTHGKTPSKTGLYPQLQAGETGTRGYSKTKV
jgi:hypothetical protein